MSDPTVLSYTIRDELGTEASSIIYIDYDGAVETEQALVGEWLAYGGDVDAVSAGQVIKGHILIPMSPDGSWKSSPDAGSRVEQTVLVNFSATGSEKRQGFDVPAFKSSLISGGKPNTASGALHTLITDVLAAFTNGNFSNSTGQAIASFKDAVLSFRKRRKQLSRSSVIYHD